MPGSVPPSWPRAPCPALWLIHDIGGGLCTLAMAVPCPPLYPTLPCEDHVPRGTAEPCCPEKGAVPVPGVSAPPPATLMGFPAGGGAGFPWKPSHPPAPTPAGPGNAAGGPLPAAPPPLPWGSPSPGRPSRHPPAAGCGRGSAPGLSGRPGSLGAACETPLAGAAGDLPREGGPCPSPPGTGRGVGVPQSQAGHQDAWLGPCCMVGDVDTQSWHCCTPHCRPHSRAPLQTPPQTPTADPSADRHRRPHHRPHCRPPPQTSLQTPVQTPRQTPMKALLQTPLPTSLQTPQQTHYSPYGSPQYSPRMGPKPHPQDSAGGGVRTARGWAAQSSLTLLG